MTEEQFKEIVDPFIQLAHCFRIGDKIYGDKFLFLCSKLLAKYYVTYQDRATLNTLIANINASYNRGDYIALADTLEYEVTQYLKSELM